VVEESMETREMMAIQTRQAQVPKKKVKFRGKKIAGRQ